MRSDEATLPGLCEPEEQWPDRRVAAGGEAAGSEHDNRRRYDDDDVAAVQPTDEALVALALDGDQEAFTLLVKRYQRRLTGFLAQLVGDLELARELAQEAFLRAWSALERFDPRYRFSTWLFRIAHNLGIDQLRRKRLPTVSLLRQDAEGDEIELSVTDGDKDPLGHLENKALAHTLRSSIDDLRPEYRELVLLRHFGGLSYQEIAELKEMPLGTVKNKLFRAHSVLRRALATFLEAARESRPGAGSEGE